MSNSFYVYIYLDPRKPGQYCYEGLNFSLLYEPFYIGRGKGYRKHAHLTPSKLYNNTHKNNKILKIISEGYDIRHYILTPIKNITNDDANKNEINFIKTIGRYDLKTGSLTNKTDGGEGILNGTLQGAVLNSKGNNNTQSLYYLINVKNMSENDAKQYLKNKAKKMLSNRASTKDISYEDRYGITKTKFLKEMRSKKFRENWLIMPKLKCPHCELEMVNPANYKRYHGDNCKHKL